jgi:hypothetical protein
MNKNIKTKTTGLTVWRHAIWGGIKRVMLSGRNGVPLKPDLPVCKMGLTVLKF